MRLETLEFYRPWCRYCGSQEGECEIADEQPWVEDEDDVGYPVCKVCINEASQPVLRVVR